MGIDPSGMDTVCTDVTGSNIPSCVTVNGAGNNTMTNSQKSELGDQFHDFIAANIGEDITNYGKHVYDANGNSMSSSNINASMLRAVSQFVGVAEVSEGDASAARWKGVVGIQYNRGGPRPTAGLDPDNVIEMNSLIDQFMNSPSNPARIMMHEKLHFGEPTTQFEAFRSWLYYHQILDNQAKSLLKASGLAGGGCVGYVGFSRC